MSSLADAERAKEEGNARRAEGDLKAAVDCYRRALAHQPGFVPGLYNLAVALRELGELAEAERGLRHLHALDPADLDVLVHLGMLLHDQSRFTEAEPFLRLALSRAPENALVLWYLGVARARARDWREAAEFLEKAVTLEPALYEARFHLGNVHSLAGRRLEAIRCYEAACQARPDVPRFMDALLFEMQGVCDWSCLEPLVEQRRRAVRERPGEPFPPFSLLSVESSRSEQLQCARNFCAGLEAAAAREAARRPPPAPARPGRPLRIGYLSGDFHEHATAYLMAELFELHDRSRVEVIGYSHGIDDASRTRGRLRRAFDRFVDVAALGGAEAAARIRADGVQVLVDLKGHTAEARPEILALRPAPVQAGYVGYPGTSGAGFIDYLIADRYVAPPEHAADYSEKLVWLPHSYQPNDRRREVGPVPPRAALALPPDAFVFCCFNQPYKIMPDVFAAWMRLLAGHPGSVLWLLEWNRPAAENLRACAAKDGISPGRLVFAPKAPLAEHLGRIQAADLFLDTFPCGAHTTASDALWAGLPVVTRAGETFASRVAGSLLNAVGCGELITHSPAEYESLAASLARDAARLKALRERLRRNRAQSALFDTPRLARHLEAAYDGMWQRHAAGKPAESFAVPA
ncbi:MAG TPA: tetratricopeptide repeat protein [Burkholderiales bacterium]|jgi:predicted O-linked N-acetylglucosamine transferase (SPINDLY family)|nr:tetratricopeptide repeat protein [Burkholderiales bacterium]